MNSYHEISVCVCHYPCLGSNTNLNTLPEVNAIVQYVDETQLQIKGLRVDSKPDLSFNSKKTGAEV